jgi:uncharacterized lipoprotein YmbA
MKPNRALTGLLLVLAVSVLVSACLNPKADPTRYYVLATLSEDPGLYPAAGLVGDTEEQASLSSGPHMDISVGVGPITLPGYLSRTRMVTRRSDNELDYLETERWAQPLEESLHNVVASDLGMILWTDRMVLHPWYSTSAPSYSVSVDITRFERGPDGAAALHARWIVRDAEGEMLANEPFFMELPTGGESIGAAVNAQSELVAAMSRDIADALRRVAS